MLGSVERLGCLRGCAGLPRRATRRALAARATQAVPAQYKTVTPVGDRVLLKVTEEESVTSGGIVLPSSAVAKPTTGVVVAVGNGRNAKTGKAVPIEVERVLYSKYAGTELRVGGEEHLILKAEDVVGTLAGDALAELKPYGDRILLRKAPLTQHTAGGVLLPGSTADGAPTGRVVAVGPGKLRDEEGGGRDPMPLSPGDAVLYTQYAGIELPGDKDSEAGYVVLRSEDIVVRLS